MTAPHVDCRWTGAHAGSTACHWHAATGSCSRRAGTRAARMIRGRRFASESRRDPMTCAASTSGRSCAVETTCSGHSQRGGSGDGGTHSLPSVASRRHPGRRGRRRPGALPLACWMLDAPSRSTAAGCWRTTTARWPLTMKTTAAASTTRTTLS